MKLEPGKKLENNLKLMRSCSQVRIIQLTEQISKLTHEQKRLIERNPEVRIVLTAELNRQLAKAGESEIENPTAEQLINIPIPGYDPKTDEMPIKQYMGALRRTNVKQRALGDYQALHEILSQSEVPFEEFTALIGDEKKSNNFKNFVSLMQQHSPILLSLGFKYQANELAERNGIANDVYYKNADKTFSLEETSIRLGNEVKGRFINVGKSIVATAAISALIIGAGMQMSKDTDSFIQGETTPHASVTETTPIPDEPIIAASPKETPSVQQTGPISINTDINSYKEACEDFFQKTAEIYKYNTGKDIDLSGYGQDNISINRTARVLKIEKDGKVFTISTQSFAAPNANYLRQAFKELGIEFTEETTRTTCIIDKNDSTKSIAIVDSTGNPVRSGNVLTETGSAGGYMYNQDMVRMGKQVLEAEGKSGSLSEAECVAAFLLSDMHNTQNPELSIALGETAGLADTIKTTFFSSSGKDDHYAIYLYTQDATKLAQRFNEKINSDVVQGAEAPTTDHMEHDER